MVPEIGNTLYRAEVIGSLGKVVYIEFTVSALTPCGMWLSKAGLGFGRQRTWRTFNTRYCSPTKERALFCLLRRKAAYIKHCRRRLRKAETELFAAQAEAGIKLELPPEPTFFDLLSVPAH